MYKDIGHKKMLPAYMEVNVALLPYLNPISSSPHFLLLNTSLKTAAELSGSYRIIQLSE
jgi:hypothetical protein